MQTGLVLSQVNLRSLYIQSVSLEVIALKSLTTHIQPQQAVLSYKFPGETAEWLIESATVYLNDMSKNPRGSLYCKSTERRRNS
jgi:hypothetical protein